MSHRALGKQFFHVSSHGFKPGDVVVPRREIGKPLSNEGYSGDADHVYMHDDIHAAVHGWGHILSQGGEAVHVYEVQPHGKVEVDKPWGEHDEDYELKATKATVLRRLGTRTPEGHYDGDLP